MNYALIQPPPKRRALIIGGSLGGLFAAVMLQTIGWDVDVFERSEGDLDSRGGGIVLQPDVIEVFRRAGVTLDEDHLGVRSAYRTVLRPDGSIQSKQFMPQMQTSWSLIYTRLKSAFGNAHYHRGRILERIEQDENTATVTAIFSDGSRETGDLLVGADGGNSTVRSQLWPDLKPVYAGYIAWRGLLPEQDLPPFSRDALAGDFGFANSQGSHILGYLVPGVGNDTRNGHRFYNWVWYRVATDEQRAAIMTDRNGKRRDYAVPEGSLAPFWITHVHNEAETFLPQAFREIVGATRQPYVQSIRDLASDHMIAGRALILGDAASIPRPHTAASTSKAAANALALAEALAASPKDVLCALARWELPQVTYGKHLEQQGKMTGDYLLFR
ncbi:2-polyprenyl-6-methoxyphenol hydroxylase [Acetobacter musti]|uniref:2-polyprenyl-6-methoxyphenol hydroxylase n=1 Tax=Acetobacter musti TaxID=864732 RepID=A0ABX0JLF9_9PROT|nr:FAD binding domain-containing protein [Acetobacter musti]NHN83835.1 2-polyprenyl-6-methoxyphenol hydroxylase [Acetobacter musti]